VVPLHHLPTSLPQRGGRSLASQERENKGDLGGAKMRFVEGAERAAHLRADGLSTLQSQPRNVGRTAAAPAGRQTRCGGLNQTDLEQRQTRDRSHSALISIARQCFCSSLSATVLRFLFHPPSPPFGVTGFPCTIYSRFSGLLGLAYFYQFATQISTPLLRSPPIDFDLFGCDTFLSTHRLLPAHFSRAVSVFKFDFVGLRP
jgi:hypothetical protein